jgi:hypothetical protein
MISSNTSENEKRKVVVDVSPDFLEFMNGNALRGGLIENYIQAQSAEVDRMVQELVQQVPSLNTPLGRFNAGQAYMIKLAALFNKMLQERLADYINYATVEFVSVTSTREAKEASANRLKPQGSAGIA